MNCVKIAKNGNGSHDYVCGAVKCSAGWAVIPDGMETENFPFGEVVVAEVGGVMTVTSWSPLPVPEPEPVPDPEPTQLDIIEAQVTYTAMMTDTLLEV